MPVFSFQSDLVAQDANRFVQDAQPGVYRRRWLLLSILLILAAASIGAQAQVPFEIGPSQSGAWFDPNHDGEGYVLEILDNNVAVVYWFTFDENGKQRWMIGVGSVNGNRIEFPDLLEPAGTNFGDEFDPEEIEFTRVGQASLEFSSCDSGRAEFTVDAVAGSLDITRLTAIAGLDCGPVNRKSDVLLSGISGSWFDPDRNGEGLAIEVFAPDSVLVYWFTYGLDGEQAWFFGIGSIEEMTLNLDQVFAPTGPVFGSDFDPDDFELNETGAMQIRLNCEGIEYDYNLGIFGEGQRSLVPLSPLPSTQCSDEATVVPKLETMLTALPSPEAFVFGASYSVQSEITGMHWQGQSGTSGPGEGALTASHAFKTGWLGEIYTATAILRLVEMGVLELDVPITQYLAEESLQGLVTFRGQDLTHQLTVRHLLSHRSGIGSLFQEPSTGVESILSRMINEPNRVIPNAEIIEYARLNLEANSAPGTDLLKSEVNYILLAELIETQTGQSLAQAVRSEVFAPVGMDQTWHLTQENTPAGIQLAAAQLGDTDVREIPSLIGFDSGNAWATTTRDMTRFIRALFSDAIFASVTTREAMFDTHESLLGAADFGLGGMVRHSDCAISQSELQGYIGTGGFAIYVPGRQTIMVGFTTQLDLFGIGLLDDVMEVVFGSSRCHDEGSWPVAPNPSTAGFSAGGLEELDEFLDSTQASAFLAVANGEIVYRHGQIGRGYASHSIRKSFLGALLGRSVAANQINLSDRLSDLGINDFTPLTAQELSAMVDDLIKSRSGIYLPAAAENPGDSKPPRGSAAPGSQFFYNNWDFNVMGTIYEGAVGASLYQRFNEEIAQPLGMDDFRVENQFYIYERRRSNHPAYMFVISARDMARFGQLYLDQGAYKGVQIVPSQWVSDSTVSYSDTGHPTRPGFGYMNWSILDDGFMATGSGGHKIRVIPAENMVVVIRVDTWNNGARVSDSTFNQAVELLLEARQ